MKSKSFIFLVVLIFMMVFSLSAVSADDLQTTDSGEVSGDVDVVTVNPWNTSGELNYDISPGATEIKSANVYVNVYAGKATNEYGAIANVSLKTDKGESQIASEELWIAEGSADGTVYTVNNHTDKCYSDYQMRYDITDSLKGLNGSSIAIHVDTFKMDGKQFDGRIKLIALVLAYDDGDSDVVSYWIDSNQKWTKTNVTTTFDTTGIKEFARAGLTNVALSSADGNFTLNGENLGTPDGHMSGSYYQFSYWGVSDKIMNETKTEITAKCTGTSSYASLKNVLTVLKVMDIPVADVSFNTEYTSVPTCYAGTNNTLTVKVNANKAGRYSLYLTADGEYVTGTEIELDGQNENTVLLTDPTVRPINETTVNGANNTKVTYGVVVSSGETIIGNAMMTVPVLYNGNLGYDKEYGVKGFEQYITSLITGDVVIDIKGDNTYLGASDMSRTDVWTVDIPEGSKLDDAFIIVPYNWFNSKSYDETEFMFNLTFNDNSLVNMTMVFERDQGNLGNYGKYGYGVLVYDVADLIKTGENTLVFNKNYPTPAVYPSALVYMYNTPGGTLKEVEITWGADLLANSYNNAGRTVKSDSKIAMEGSEFVNATLYVLAAGAQAGEGNIVFNGEEFVNVWNGTSKTTDLFVANITDIVGNNNKISFVATGSTILALPQIIIADTGDVLDVDSVKTEYTSVPAIYAGTNNTFTVTVDNSIAGEFEFYLYDISEGKGAVDHKIINLTKGINTILLTDPTIRPINETTVSGANNTKVKYLITFKYKNYYYEHEVIELPVLYNGNLGYDMEYGVDGFEQAIVSLITGDVVVDVKDDSTYLGASDMSRTDVWTVDIPEGSKLDDAFIIVPYNWFNGNSYNETEFMFNLTFNDNAVVNRTMVFERDQGNLGKYGKYGYGVLVYDVADLIKTGENTLVLNKNYPTPAVYPSALYYTYNTPGGTLKEVEITWGADLLANSYNNAGRTVKSDSKIAMYSSEFVNATLYVLAAGAQSGEGNIVFNGEEFVNVWNGTSKTTDLFVANITDIVGNNNKISFVATGSTILALPQIIVADTGCILSVDSVKTEYTSVPAIYAGTNNTFTVTLTNNVAGEFEFYLYEMTETHGAVDHKIINLTEGTSTILLTDPTIRPINETTVSGANNTKVKYLVVIKYKDYYYEHDAMILPVLYNGYLGKDMAYNATYIENVTVIQVTGGVKSIVQNDTTYMGSAATNRTDILTVDLDEKSSLVKAFVYLAYNWDKSGANGPAFNVTFNGNTIVPKAHYRDQSNLGNSGAYGYGLFVYDVIDLALNGNNTLVIQKPKGLTAVYPSNFIYLYDTVSSGLLKTVYLADGADLMANSYNVAGRPVNTGSQIIVDVKDLSEAELFIFAAGAQTGEGNIIFNGIENVNVWNGTSKSVNLFTQSITSSVADSNNISFVATGSTILALNQMIVTSQDVPIKTTLTVKALSTTYDSGKAFTVKVLDETKKPVSKLTLTLKIYTGSKYITRTVTTNANGIASFASASKLAIGTHKVVITSTNKKYDVAKTTSSIKVSKAKTTVKAPKVSAKVKKSKYFKILVKNKATKKVVKNLKVKVKIYTGKKSKTYTVKTNSKGLAKLNTKSLKVGKHKVVITSGNAKYVVSAKSTIVIKK